MKKLINIFIGVFILVIILSLIGYSAGLLFNELISMPIDGKSVIDYVRDGVYNFFKGGF